MASECVNCSSCSHGASHLYDRDSKRRPRHDEKESQLSNRKACRNDLREETPVDHRYRVVTQLATTITQRETVITPRETVITRREQEITQAITGIAQASPRVTQGETPITRREIAITQPKTSITQKEVRKHDEELPKREDGTLCQSKICQSAPINYRNGSSEAKAEEAIAVTAEYFL